MDSAPSPRLLIKEYNFKEGKKKKQCLNDKENRKELKHS